MILDERLDTTMITLIYILGGIFLAGIVWETYRDWKCWRQYKAWKKQMEAEHGKRRNAQDDTF